jgi:hypothetical protein
MSDREWIPAADVQVGDQLAHKLSNTPWTYTPVTGWSDKVLHLGGSLGNVTQRRFTVSGAPWWVTSDAASLWHSLDGQALVLNLGKYPEPEPMPEPEPEPEPVTRIVLGDDYYGFRMPVPSGFTDYLLASTDDKWAVLESIGITRRDDVSPLAAWRDAVADETGIPRAQLDPAQGGVFDIGFTPAYVRKFVFFLA